MVIGIPKGLKICRGQPRGGSGPTSATIFQLPNQTNVKNCQVRQSGEAVFLENDENSHVFNASFYFVESHSLVVKENQFGRAAFPIHSSSRVIRFNFRCARFSVDESVFHLYLLASSRFVIPALMAGLIRAASGFC